MTVLKCPKCEKEYYNQNSPFYCHCGFYISSQTISIPKNKINANEYKSPSIVKKIQNFATSVVNHISNGMIKVSDPIKEERMAICRACPLFNSSNKTCNKCGCFLEVKTSWASEKCPEGKWDEVKTQSSGGCGCNNS